MRKADVSSISRSAVLLMTPWPDDFKSRLPLCLRSYKETVRRHFHRFELASQVVVDWRLDVNHDTRRQLRA